MKASIRGTEIFFDVAGMQVVLTDQGIEERPIIFLLHGGPGGDHTRFKQHTLELQNDAQLLFIDHRGSGRSKKTRPSEYNLINNIEDVEALRQYLGLEKICLLGTSYGGMVAQGYATRYSNHLDKLILVATAPSYRFMEESKKYLQQHATPQQIAICEHLWNGSFKDSAHVNEFLRLMDPLYTLHPENFLLTDLKMSWSYEALNNGFGGFLRSFDFLPHLKQITCKTLILGGEQDWIIRPSQPRLISEHIPGSKLVIFSNCGHSVAIDAHDDYIKEIRQFLGDNEAN